MMTTIRTAATICLLSVIVWFAMGCSARATKEAKVPTAVGSHQRTAATSHQLPAPAATSDKIRIYVDAVAAPQAITSSSPPDESYEKRFYVEISAMGRPIVEGELLEVEFSRMLFLRDIRMAPDCTNVQAKNLYVQSMSSICQVGVLPLEQGFKPGSRKTASWKVGTETRTFSFDVVSDKH